MKLLRVLIVAILISTIANASASTLEDQGSDTLKNIARFGYTKGSSKDGSDDIFTFSQETVSNVLHLDFDPEAAAWAFTLGENPTKVVKKFLQVTITQIRNKFPGNTLEEKKTIFLQALQNTSTGAIRISGKDLGSPRNSQRLANLVYDGLKDIVAGIQAQRSATRAYAKAIEDAKRAGAESARAAQLETVRIATDFHQKIITLYTDGILVDSTIDVATIGSDPIASYPLILASLRRLGSDHTSLAAVIASPKKRSPLKTPTS